MRLVLVLLIVLAVLGVTYETVAARGDAERFPPPGTLVDVGGHRLHLYCTGSGGPTVVLEGGSGSTVLDWSMVQPALGEHTRVCAYDRAGLGWSEPSAQPRTPGVVTSELHTLLQEAGVTPPYILVGASLGGKYIRMFAQQYPDEVAGLVFLDARHERFEEAAPTKYRRMERILVPAVSHVTALAGRLGVARLAGLPYTPEALAPELRDALHVLASRPQAAAMFREEFFAQWTDGVDRAGETLGDKPVIVLVAGEGGMTMTGWGEAQQEMVRLSTKGQLRTLHESGHAIFFDAPDEVVAAVEEVLAAVR